MAEIRKDLADVRSLCRKIMNRVADYRWLALSSLRQLPTKRKYGIFGSSNANYDHPESTFSSRSNRSGGSITNIALSYWAASIIDLYCVELAQVSWLYSKQEESISGVPSTQKFDTAQNLVNPPSVPISHEDSPCETAVTVVRPVILTDESSIGRFPWAMGPPIGL